ncbi:hypothetical protein [Paraburkholderia sp. JHI869]|uniref:hypothetical protein n=1 Tax=Paraburkholderia sp. JHI869 TaxID=3112959 RepID=UPI00319E226E
MQQITQALACVFADMARTGYHHDLVGNTSTPPQYDPDTSRKAQGEHRRAPSQAAACGADRHLKLAGRVMKRVLAGWVLSTRSSEDVAAAVRETA